MTMEVPQELEARIDAAIAPYTVSKRSAVLPVLHLLQEHFRYLSEEAVNWAAAKLGLPPIQVLEVVTFYPGFRQSPPGKRHVRICRTLSCAMAGSSMLMQEICEKYGIDLSTVDHHHPVAVSKDGSVSVEFVECLASCGSAPVCLVEDDFHERVTATRLETILGAPTD